MEEKGGEGHAEDAAASRLWAAHKADAPGMPEREFNVGGARERWAPRGIPMAENAMTRVGATPPVRRNLLICNA